MNNLIYQAFAKQLLNKSLLNLVLVYHVESIPKPSWWGLSARARLYQKHINICINFTTEVEYYMCHCLESTAQSSKIRQVVEVKVRL